MSSGLLMRLVDVLLFKRGVRLSDVHAERIRTGRMLVVEAKFQRSQWTCE